jgi:hypothetical protein
MGPAGPSNAIFALQMSDASVTFSDTPRGNDLMATLFHISTNDRLAGQDVGMGAWQAFAGSRTVNDGTIVPAGRRARS